MALEQEDVATIIEVVEEIMGRRLEAVFGAIEQLREEIQQTVTTLNGNDLAVIGALQHMKLADGGQVAAVLERAGESWQRFLVNEAKEIGLKVIAPKGGRGTVMGESGTTGVKETSETGQANDAGDHGASVLGVTR